MYAVPSDQRDPASVPASSLPAKAPAGTHPARLLHALARCWRCLQLPPPVPTRRRRFPDSRAAASVAAWRSWCSPQLPAVHDGAEGEVARQRCQDAGGGARRGRADVSCPAPAAAPRPGRHGGGHRGGGPASARDGCT